ncbi:MAG: hypothetical protein WD270_06140 [Acetobacterales bacterium]
MKLSETDDREIRHIHDAWIATEAAGKNTEVTAFLANDIVALPDGGAPVCGKAAVRAAFFASDGSPCEIESVITSLEPAGGAVLKIADFRTTDAGGVEIAGSHAWLLVRDNKWKIRFMTWTIRRTCTPGSAARNPCAKDKQTRPCLRYASIV